MLSGSLAIAGSSGSRSPATGTVSPGPRGEPARPQLATVCQRIQGKDGFPAGCPNCLHKLSPYLFQLSSKCIMQPQCSLFYVEKLKSHFRLLLQLQEPPERGQWSRQHWPLRSPKHTRLEKVLESLQTVEGKGWESGLHLRGSSVRAG